MIRDQAVKSKDLGQGGAEDGFHLLDFFDYVELPEMSAMRLAREIELGISGPLDEAVAVGMGYPWFWPR